MHYKRLIKSSAANLNRFSTTLVAISAITATAVTAQEVIDPEASPFQVEVGAVYVDELNPTRQNSGSGYGLRISPSGKLVSKSEGQWFQASYEADVQYFNVDDQLDGEDDTFAAYSARLLSRTYLTPKWTFDAYAEYRAAQERYGAGLSRLRTNLVAADEFNEHKLGSSFTYGGDTSKRSIALRLETRDRDYESNNLYSDSFDQSQNTAELAMGYSVSSDTRIIAELVAQDDDFDSLVRPDSLLTSASVGFSWKTSGKTSVRALVGAYSRDTDGASKANGARWSLNAVYVPSDVWEWSLISARDSIVDASELAVDSIRESVGFGGAIKPKDHIAIRFKGLFAQTQFEELLQTRTLDEMEWTLNAQFESTEHSGFNVSLQYIDREENIGLVDFDQTSVRLSWYFEL